MEARLAYERVRRHLEALRMHAALESLDGLLEAARVEELPPVAVLDRLLGVELSARHDRRVETNLKFAGLPYRQRLDEFDFDAQPSIDPQLIARLATLRFLEEGVNVLLLGPPGVGKTALAIGLGLEALEAGHRIFFIACHDLVARFRRAQRADRLDRLLTTMLRPKLLILDEIGYTPLERPEATLLFEIVAKRYDRRKPMIVTSNKSWGAWGDILPDQVMTAAILDRPPPPLRHHQHPGRELPAPTAPHPRPHALAHQPTERRCRVAVKSVKLKPVFLSNWKPVLTPRRSSGPLERVLRLGGGRGRGGGSHGCPAGSSTVAFRRRECVAGISRDRKDGHYPSRRGLCGAVRCNDLRVRRTVGGILA